MIKLGEFFNTNKSTLSSFPIKEGDLFIINVCFAKLAFDTLLTGNINTISTNSAKSRPILIFKTENNFAFFIALSSSASPLFQESIEFDYSNCNINNSCTFKFNQKARVFILYDKVKRNGKVYFKPQKLSKFKINTIKLNFLLQSDELENIKKHCRKESYSLFDFLNFCGECNCEYISTLILRIANHGR